MPALMTKACASLVFFPFLPYSPIVLLLTDAAIQALDILCRHKSSMELFNHKNSLFTSNNSQLVGNGVEVWYALRPYHLTMQGKEFINPFDLELVISFSWFF
jgi:hypothetical protein